MEIMKDKEYSFVFPKGFFVNIFLSPTNCYIIFEIYIWARQEWIYL